MRDTVRTDRDLRIACENKGTLVERGQGNCRRYREECGRPSRPDICADLRQACLYKDALGKRDSSSGGLLGDALKGFNLGDPFGASPLPKYAYGGYMGAGSRLEPAGIVHRGEYVMDAATVRRLGVGTLDAVRGALPGYADGGLVGLTREMIGASRAGAANSNGGTTEVHLHSAPEGTQVTGRQTTSRKCIDIDMLADGMEKRQAGRVASGQGSLAQVVPAGRRLRD
ncbi:hypothetical protein [Methylobacterium oxalidis]|uniref:Uncharacterized protein n=1 Tax=Methylobacterium oxalidis TaxID=944322 RepID=A0A512IZL7_9HYPH|nr:hypothetical protein [Methylobacterium oxalidis]GEP03059.1 hypothetical protein MOX02_10970 [Methylobacterium oxalidis]GJE32827.1 hypothetical protein LDDCCGHA_3021 [Methylobacterium oxalidis]GLS67318.1 hypothetical protein GCM10007888_57020 [Methylobacterium oxalidis]